MLIRAATFEDARYLPHIEKSASELYRAIPRLAPLADGRVIVQSVHERRILNKTVWVAETSQRILVGFLNAEVFNHELHIWELSVHVDWQRQGVGTGLLRSAYRYSLLNGLCAVTLTTFKDVPWCAPAYAKFGFKFVKNPVLHLRRALDVEAAHDLPIEPRVAMRLCVRAAKNVVMDSGHFNADGMAQSLQ